MNYINGKYVVNKFSEGQMYGLGVFETILVEDKHPEYLKEHYERTVKGCESLGVNFEMTYDGYKKQIKNYIERNPKSRYAMRVTVSQNSYTYDFMINDRDITYSKETYEKGFKIKVADVMKNSTSPLTYVKSLNYSENLLTLRKAREQMFDEVIYLNEKGEISEGSISNLFFVKDGVVKTPMVECGLLEGIMRNKIMNELEECGMKVEEGRYSLEELMESEEIFLTNSLMRVMPVSEVEGKKLSSKKVCEILVKGEYR